MNESLLAEMQAVLSARAQELRSTLALMQAASAPESPDNEIGRLTRVDAMQAVSVRQALARDHEAELRLVERALGAIADGEYGVCRRCGEPIADGFLMSHTSLLTDLRKAKDLPRRAESFAAGLTPRKGGPYRPEPKKKRGRP